MPAAGRAAMQVVIDTNVVLDWLVFRDPALAPLFDHTIAVTRQLKWIASEAMRDEFARVVARGLRSRPALDADAALGAWRRHATLVEPAPAAGLRWPCRDPDDQKFLDLALAHRGCCLLTRDRALLVFARRAREHDVTIATPATWVGASGRAGATSGA